MLMGNFLGKKLFENPLMCDTTMVQVRFPKSRRKRIRKKWRRDGKNYRQVIKPWDKLFVVGENVVGHPVMIQRLKGLLEDHTLKDMTYDEARIFC